MRTLRTILLSLTLITAPAAPLLAQAPDTTAKPAPFFTWSDALLAGGFVAAALVLDPLDVKIANRLQDSTLQANKFLRDVATAFRLMGQPGPEIIGVVLYGVGRATHSTHVQKLAVHGVEALILGSAISLPTKIIAGRARPFEDPNKSLASFSFMRGLPVFLGGKGSDFQSFPSGHATTAFAVASAASSEFGHWFDEAHAWEGYKYLVGITLYGGAALVGASRMYNNKHWTSDVVVGAMIGTFSGLKTVEYNYRHPNNRVERFLVKMQIVPGARGSPTWITFSMGPAWQLVPD